MFRIFGPPGTGKTTTLLNIVEKALDTGASPTSIAFLAFTRKAAQEAKTRACQKFNFDPDKDLPFFRTIHSLAYRMSNVRESQLLQAEHFDELSKKIGVSMTVTRVSEDDDDAGVTSDHPILSLINLARLRKVTLRQQYDLSSIQHTWEEVSYVDRAYRAYKETMGLYDYTDILDKFVREGIAYCPRFQLTFMDEAQDLSPMQWDIAHALDDISDRMYCAGDDDQAIYRWAGADVDHFINLPGGAEILEQSYRIPASVHVVAERIASRIERRYKKVYKPRTEQGRVDRIYSVGELDMTQGGWLVMAQANYMLTPVADELKRAGLLFERNGRRSISERISLAVNGWESLRKNRSIDCTTAQAIYDYMSGNGKRVCRGYKKFSDLDKDKLFDMPTLQLQYGLAADPNMPWYDALDKLPAVDQVYIRALLRSGEKFNAPPRIKLSTIHGTKGGEADNVVLFTDLSPAAMDEYGDDLHRVFYVGVTRTRQNLFIVEPEDATRSYLI
jgi:DNA helicase II / ATP-dependent DNA helicase PcrA